MLLFRVVGVVYPLGDTPGTHASSPKIYLVALRSSGSEPVPKYIQQLGWHTVLQERTQPIFLAVCPPRSSWPIPLSAPPSNHTTGQSDARATRAQNNIDGSFGAPGPSIQKSPRGLVPEAVPASHPATSTTYEDVVDHLLSSAPPHVVVAYESSTDPNSGKKDPRLLLPYASVAQKKVLNAWLDRNYFIPSYSPDDPLSEMPAKRKRRPSGVRDWDDSLELIDSPVLDDISNMPLRGVDSGRLGGNRVKSSLRDKLFIPFVDVVSGTVPPPKYTPPLTLKPLLAACEQEQPYEFADFVNTAPFDEKLHGADIPDTGAPLYKASEASFSEVFAVGRVVLKIVPIALDDSTAGLHAAEAEGEIMWPTVSDPGDVLKEIEATKLIGAVHPSFVKLLRCVMNYNNPGMD